MGIRVKKENKKIECRKIDKREHGINVKDINQDAAKIITRLNSFGYQGYIVGGAVRDLLSGRVPKDFDVVTDAVPNQLRKIFRNSRIIGRRFRLVHIYFSGDIIETATFRADSDNGSKESIIRNDNIYGSIEDDVVRRDFSINALYYDPVTEIILDFVGGYDDILNKRVRTLKNEKTSFLEDPVRMLRAVKYSVLLNCTLNPETCGSIKKYGKEISKCSVSRLYEEYNKIFKSGKAVSIFMELFNLKLLKYLIPFLYNEFSGKDREEIIAEMNKFEEILLKSEIKTYEIFWIIMTKRLIDRKIAKCKDENLLELIKSEFDKYLLPINVPRKVIEDMAKAYFIYYKYSSSVEELEKIRKYRMSNSFDLVIAIFNMYCRNEDILEVVKSFKFTKKLSKEVSVVKKKTSNVNYKNKRFVETKKNIIRAVATDNVRGAL